MDGDLGIITEEGLVALLASLPPRGKISQEGQNLFSCIQLGPKWQQTRKVVVAACECIFEYHKKIAEGKHKLTAKLRDEGVNVDGLEFGFFFPLSPSGYHVSLKPPDPSKVKSVVGSPVKFNVDKIFLQGANLGVPNMFDPSVYVATWVQLAVNVVDVAEPVQKVIGSTKRAHISLCCYGCRVKGGVGGGGGGGKASATGKKKKKKR